MSNIGWLKYHLLRTGYIIHKITFIGIIIHELAHQLIIALRGYSVYEVDYLSHVKHEMPTNLIDALYISYAPLLVNVSLSMAISWVVFGWPSAGELVTGTPKEMALDIFFLYIIVSLLFHAIPSLEDMENIVKLVVIQIKHLKILSIVLAALLSVLFVPTYIALKVARKTRTKFIVNIIFCVVALCFILGIIEWWTIIPGLNIESSIEQILENY